MLAGARLDHDYPVDRHDPDPDTPPIEARQWPIAADATIEGRRTGVASWGHRR